MEDNKCVKLVAEDVILTKTNEEENPLNVAAYSVNLSSNRPIVKKQ